MAKHLPSSVWLARKPGAYPNCEVSTLNERQVKVAVFMSAGDGCAFVTDRRSAALIAKRIMQCLQKSR